MRRRTVERAAKAQNAGELKALLPLFRAELSAVLHFLASDNAACITGTNLSVNGGLHMYA